MRGKIILSSLSEDQAYHFWNMQLKFLVDQVVLLHCKLVEVKGRFAKIIPEPYRAELNQYFDQSRVNCLSKVRNKYVGHAIDKDTKEPLDSKEIESLIFEIFGGSDIQKDIVKSFFDRNFPGNPKTLVGMIEAIIDSLERPNSLPEQ